MAELLRLGFQFFRRAFDSFSGCFGLPWELCTCVAAEGPMTSNRAAASASAKYEDLMRYIVSSANDVVLQLEIALRRIVSSLRLSRTGCAAHPVLVHGMSKVYEFAQTTNHRYEKVGHRDRFGGTRRGYVGKRRAIDSLPIGVRMERVDRIIN